MTKIVSRRLIGSQDDKNDDNDRNGAIPHTFGAYDHVTEVEYVPGKSTLPEINLWDP